MTTSTTGLSSSSPSASAVLGLGLPLMAVLLLATVATAAPPVSMDPDVTLGCFRRMYTYRVVQTDSQGRMCWDMVSVMSCWGRCDTHEIADWRFPFKTAHHRVCLHDNRQVAVHRLRHCEAGVEPGTERYKYLEALTCRCLSCKSSEASCEGLRSRATTKAGPLLSQEAIAAAAAAAAAAVTTNSDSAPVVNAVSI